MKELIIIFLAAILLFGCSADKEKPSTTTTRNSETEQNQKNSTTNRSSAVSKPVNVEGAKIEKPIELKFDTAGLPTDWVAIAPKAKSSTSFDTNDGVLKLRIPVGADLFGSNQSAPRILKTISGDFEIETKIKFDPKSDYQGAGILIWNNERNFLRFERGFGGVDGGGSGVRLDKSVDGNYLAISGTEQNPTENPEVELKVMRKGKEFIAFLRENIDGEWKEIGLFKSDFPESVQVGIIGVSTTGEIIAEFKYIRIAPIN